MSRWDRVQAQKVGGAVDHLELLDLAGHGQRKFAGKHKVAWDFVVRHVVTAELVQAAGEDRRRSSRGVASRLAGMAVLRALSWRLLRYAIPPTHAGIHRVLAPKEDRAGEAAVAPRAWSAGRSLVMIHAHTASPKLGTSTADPRSPGAVAYQYVALAATGQRGAAVQGIWNSHNGDVVDVGVREEDILHLPWRDVFAAANDQVLDPSHDATVAVLVDRCLRRAAEAPTQGPRRATGRTLDPFTQASRAPRPRSTSYLVASVHPPIANRLARLVLAAPVP